MYISLNSCMKQLYIMKEIFYDVFHKTSHANNVIL
jgi:hypothetical protein